MIIVTLLPSCISRMNEISIISPHSNMIYVSMAYQFNTLRKNSVNLNMNNDFDIVGL